MTNRHEEILSAFVDEETSAFEARVSVKQLVTDETHRSRWERYHLIRDTLRGNVPPILDREFCSKIMSAVDRMAAVESPENHKRKRPYARFKPIAGVALAASIAVVTVLSVKTLMNQTPSLTSGQVAQLRTSDQQAATTREVKTGTTVKPPNPREDARLNSYLVNHAEYASRRSMIPYARLVGYDTNQQ